MLLFIPSSEWQLWCGCSYSTSCVGGGMNSSRRKQLYSLQNYIHAGVGAGLPFQMVIVPLAVTASWMQLFASACLSKIMPCFASSLLPVFQLAGGSRAWILKQLRIPSNFKFRFTGLPTKRSNILLQHKFLSVLAVLKFVAAWTCAQRKPACIEVGLGSKHNRHLLYENHI